MNDVSRSNQTSQDINNEKQLGHSAENDVPRSSWLEAVIRAAVVDWNSNPDRVGDDVSWYLTCALWPVIQVDREQTWGEGYEAGHQDARAVQATYPDPTPNPYTSVTPPGGDL